MTRSFNGMNADSDTMYDDSAFQIFAVGFLAVFWVPVALYKLIRFIRRRLHKKTPMELAKEAWCGCFHCQEKADKIELKTKGLKNLGIGDIIFGIVTVLLFISVMGVIRANIKSDAPFDPFDILDIPKSATQKQIKKAYRRLSVVHHPDKNPDDRDGAAERFLKISKAYAALSDEESMENYKKYGNPDGPTGTTVEVGLPEWIGNSSNAVLFFYGLFIVIVFPVMVGIWWHKSKKQFNQDIMMSTFFMYLETLKHTKRFRDLIVAFCGSDEFNPLYTTDNEEAIAELADSLRRIGGSFAKRQRVFEPSLAQHQNVHVMAAYMARIDIPKKLEYVLEGMLVKAESLMTAMTDLVGALGRPDCKAAWGQVMQGNTTFLMRCIHISQCIFQALDERSSVLLQIPHFTEREVKYCTNRNGTTKSIFDIMRMDADELRRVLKSLNDVQLLDVRAFCDRFPVATLEVDMPTVEGEEDCTVHEGDAVTIRTTLRILRRNGSAFSPCTSRLPFRKEEVWWLWLADQNRQMPISVRRLLPKMARGHDGSTKRRKFGDEDDDDLDDDEDFGADPSSSDDDEVDENGVTLSAADKKKRREAKLALANRRALERQRKKRRDEEFARLVIDPRVTVFEVVFRFPAPAAGLYTLEVGAACDCYAGAAKFHLMNMHVRDAVKVPEPEPIVFSDEEDEDEDEDEESSEEEEEEEEANGNRDQSAGGSGNDGDDEDESEYEYIEVTASESEAGDFDDDDDDDDDDFGVSGPIKGDPGAH